MKTGPEYHLSNQKRRFDVLVSLGCLPVAGLVTFGAGLYIRKEIAPESIFLRQKRFVKGMELVEIIKLRTLKNCDDRPIATFGTVDPRAPKRAHQVRKSGIDELPQFANVLKGTMSIVGPRPLLLKDHEKLRDADRIMYDTDWLPMTEIVKPGLVSKAGILRHGATELTPEVLKASMESDLEYLNKGSLIVDIGIVAGLMHGMVEANQRLESLLEESI